MITVTLSNFYDVDYIYIRETRVFDSSIRKIKDILHNLGDPRVIDYEITSYGFSDEYYRPLNENSMSCFEILENYPSGNGDSHLKGNLMLELLCQQGGTV